MNSVSLLSVRGLETVYVAGGRRISAVTDVSFDVGFGEMLGIVGESGCGKSTTARSILGLVRPPGRVLGGSAIFMGKDVLALKEAEMRRVRGKQIGFIPQNPIGSLNPVMTVGRQFDNALRAHPGARGGRIDRVRTEVRALQGVGLNDPDKVLGSYPHELSGGMAQRVLIAFATALGPELVVADEPTTGLDVTVQRQVLDLVASLCVGGRRSVLLITHDLGVVAQYCDRVLVMLGGQIVEAGPTRSVLKGPIHPYTRSLVLASSYAGMESNLSGDALHSPHVRGLYVGSHVDGELTSLGGGHYVRRGAFVAERNPSMGGESGTSSAS